MSRVGCHKWRRVVLRAVVLGLLILSAGRADAQSPVIIPGLPGASLQAGARPLLTAWPYSDLPGGDVATPDDSSDDPQPAIPPFGITGDWLGAAMPCSTRGSIFARTSRSSTRE